MKQTHWLWLAHFKQHVKMDVERYLLCTESGYNDSAFAQGANLLLVAHGRVLLAVCFRDPIKGITFGGFIYDIPNKDYGFHSPFQA